MIFSFQFPVSSFQKIIRKIFAFVLLVAGGWWLVADPVQAQSLTTDITKEITALNFFQQDIGVFITRLVEVAMIAGAIILLLYLIWGAIDWISSEGNKEKYESARNKITHALLGMAILASVWALWQLANYFLGIDRIFSGGGRPAVSTSGGEEDWWPFANRAEWEDAFAAEHGDTRPTLEDEAAFHESQPYAREENRPLTPADWEYYYEHGRWPD